MSHHRHACCHDLQDSTPTSSIISPPPPFFYTHTAYGKRENVETTIHGRMIFDLLPYMFRNHKLSSYSLNSVSAEFLGQQKEVRCWGRGRIHRTK